MKSDEMEAGKTSLPRAFPPRQTNGLATDIGRR